MDVFEFGWEGDGGVVFFGFIDEFMGCGEGVGYSDEVADGDEAI